MSIEAMKQALEAKQTPLIELLERVPADARMVYEHDQFHSENIPVGRLCHEAAAALRAAIEQAEKPVAWMNGYGDVVNYKCVMYSTPLYTTPPAAQRQWVGLTDKEINAIYVQHHNQFGECISGDWGYERDLEAKLKEKNHAG